MKNWIKYARFEQKRGRVASARSVYKRAIEFFGDENLDPQLVVAFAQFEEWQHEVFGPKNTIVHCTSACNCLLRLNKLSDFTKIEV